MRQDTPKRHPTPGEIRNAIFEALADDTGKHGPTDLMPPRVYRVVSDAIAKACDEVET